MEFKLEEIYPDEKYVHESLGITKERKKELRKSTEHALVEHDCQLEAALDAAFPTPPVTVTIKA